MTDHDLRPPRPSAPRRGRGTPLAATALLLALAAGGWYAWQHTQAPHVVAPPAPTPAAPEPVAAPQPPAPEPMAAAAPPEGPQHPVAAPADTASPAPDAAGFEQAVGDWLGRPQVLKFVALQGLAHHIVATIDNLPRGHAAPRLWPLYPVGGRMLTQQAADGSLQIAPGNSARYDAVVGWIASVDVAQAAALYRRFYPVLQQAYEALGYPGQYFNDRLVAVIDHLLQAPEVQGPLALRLVEVQGSVAPQQPWLRYELADPQWQSLSAGHKILLRLGPAHAQTLKTQLRALRSQIATARPGG